MHVQLHTVVLPHVGHLERPVLMGDIITGKDHYVAVADLERGNGSGQYIALCGQTITADSLVAPPKRVCRICHDWRIC